MRTFRSYLPSNRLAITALSLLVIAISGIIVVKQIGIIRERASVPAKSPQVSPTVVTAPAASLIDRDTDHDGVADWEELLWDTNPAIADTNGDGVSDKVEIEKKKSSLALASESTSSGESATLSQTDALARSLFATIVSLRQSGSYSAENLAIISKSLSDTIGTQKELTNTYSSASITSVAASKNSAISYRSTVDSILKKPVYSRIGTELPVLARIAGETTIDENIYFEIGDTARSYKALAKELSHISVPADAVLYHLNLINTYDHIGTALANIESSKDDPIIGLVGISQYNQYSGLLDTIAGNFESYFTSYGIIGE